jgi:hypothetical protein
MQSRHLVAPLTSDWSTMSYDRAVGTPVRQAASPITNTDRVTTTRSDFFPNKYSACHSTAARRLPPSGSQRLSLGRPGGSFNLPEFAPIAATSDCKPRVPSNGSSVFSN